MKVTEIREADEMRRRATATTRAVNVPQCIVYMYSWRYLYIYLLSADA